MGLTADSTLNLKTQQQKNIQNEAQREKNTENKKGKTETNGIQ